MSCTPEGYLLFLKFYLPVTFHHTCCCCCRNIPSGLLFCFLFEMNIRTVPGSLLISFLFFSPLECVVLWPTLVQTCCRTLSLERLKGENLTQSPRCNWQKNEANYTSTTHHRRCIIVQVLVCVCVYHLLRLRLFHSRLNIISNISEKEKRMEKRLETRFTLVRLAPWRAVHQMTG